MPASYPIDLSLLEGISFQCRPGCGLCCFTTPAVDPTEADRLIQLDPTVPLLEGEEEWRFVANQGEGGACHFLSQCECRAYKARPFCCQEFPLSVHLGHRAQATVVLSCPGVAVAGWEKTPGRPVAGVPPQGLEGEIASVQREYARQPHAQRALESARRWKALSVRRARDGAWADPDAIRATLRPRLAALVEAAYPPPPPPPISEGIEVLPLLFDREAGLVAIADHPGGWELISVEETGTSSRSRGVWPAPDRRPSVSAEGNRVLESYLDYLLRRDFTYWAAAERLRTEPQASLAEAVAEDIGRYGALVLARGQLIDRFHSGGSGSLTVERVWDGIRATDGEFLDRPTLGWVL